MTAKFDHMMKSGLGDLFGRGATGNSHAVLTRAKIQIDDALGKVRAIEADQTRTRAEKSHLLKKLDSKLKETMARAQADLDSTLKADRQRVESAVAEFSMGKMTDEMALGLAIHLRQADLGERAALLAADPRFIHAEFMTHRQFSRNASSSRAVPIGRVIQEVMDDTAMPVSWGKNQPGMQAGDKGGVIGLGIVHGAAHAGIALAEASSRQFLLLI